MDRAERWAVRYITAVAVLSLMGLLAFSSVMILIGLKLVGVI